MRDDEWIDKRLRGRNVQHNPSRAQIYDCATGEVMGVQQFFRLDNEGYFDNKNGDNNMNENDKVQSLELGGFKTRSVQTSAGYVGQIYSGLVRSDRDRLGDGGVFWDSEPFETRDDAMTEANAKLAEKLKSLFA